jgi:hypothetical protein
MPGALPTGGRIVTLYFVPLTLDKSLDEDKIQMDPP